MTSISAPFQPVAPGDFTDAGRGSDAEPIYAISSSPATAQYAPARNRRNDRKRFKNKRKYRQRGTTGGLDDDGWATGSVVVAGHDRRGNRGHRLNRGVRPPAYQMMVKAGNACSTFRRRGCART